MTENVGSDREALARRIREILVPTHSVREVNMFGGLSFMVDERMAVAAGRTGDLLVRINPAHYERLLERGAAPAHMADDRSIGRGWLSVPSRQIQRNEDLAYWIEVGVDSRGAST